MRGLCPLVHIIARLLFLVWSRITVCGPFALLWMIILLSLDARILGSRFTLTAAIRAVVSALVTTLVASTRKVVVAAAGRYRY